MYTVCSLGQIQYMAQRMTHTDRKHEPTKYFMAEENKAAIIPDRCQPNKDTKLILVGYLWQLTYFLLFNNSQQYFLVIHSFLEINLSWSGADPGKGVHHV